MTSTSKVSVGPSLRIARAISYLLDDCRLDPILGLLFPLLGDAICGIFSLSLIIIAWKRQVHRLTLARMLLNVGIDASLGAIPVLGDIFDFLFRANTLNLKLLERSQIPSRSHWRDGFVLFAAGIMCLAAIIAPIVFGVWLLTFLKSPQA